jgi:hypothetical protein
MNNFRFIKTIHSDVGYTFIDVNGKCMTHQHTPVTIEIQAYDDENDMNQNQCEIDILDVPANLRVDLLQYWKIKYDANIQEF